MDGSKRAEPGDSHGEIPAMARPPRSIDFPLSFAALADTGSLWTARSLAGFPMRWIWGAVLRWARNSGRNASHEDGEVLAEMGKGNFQEGVGELGGKVVAKWWPHIRGGCAD